MAKPNVVKIPLEKTINKFDVRVELDDDRVVQFIGMYEAHLDVPPIQVVELADGNYAYVDGRTRGAAQTAMGRKEADAIIMVNLSTGQLYGYALRANWGGAKPPTRSDLTHTIARMLEAGETPTSIRRELPFLPRGSINAYIATAQGMLTKRRIAVALDSVAQGEITLAEAAKTSMVDITTLRVALKGKNKGFRSRTEQQERAHNLQLHILHSLQKANMSIGAQVSDLLQEVEHGDMSPALAEQVIQAWFRHLKKATLKASDWGQRLQNITSKFNIEEGVG
jgi:hypothetical protein